MLNKTFFILVMLTLSGLTNAVPKKEEEYRIYYAWTEDGEEKVCVFENLPAECMHDEKFWKENREALSKLLNYIQKNDIPIYLLKEDECDTVIKGLQKIDESQLRLQRHYHPMSFSTKCNAIIKLESSEYCVDVLLKDGEYFRLPVYPCESYGKVELVRENGVPVYKPPHDRRPADDTSVDACFFYPKPPYMNKQPPDYFRTRFSGIHYYGTEGKVEQVCVFKTLPMECMHGKRFWEEHQETLSELFSYMEKNGVKIKHIEKSKWDSVSEKVKKEDSKADGVTYHYCRMGLDNGDCALIRLSSTREGIYVHLVKVLLSDDTYHSLFVYSHGFFKGTTSVAGGVSSYCYGGGGNEPYYGYNRCDVVFTYPIPPDMDKRSLLHYFDELDAKLDPNKPDIPPPKVDTRWKPETPAASNASAWSPSHPIQTTPPGGWDVGYTVPQASPAQGAWSSPLFSPSIQTTPPGGWDVGYVPPGGWDVGYTVPQASPAQGAWSSPLFSPSIQTTPQGGCFFVYQFNAPMVLNPGC